MYFLHIYLYGTLKPVEVILGRGRGKKKNNRGDDPNWHTLYIYTWKCHRETPVQLLHANKNFKKKIQKYYLPWM
jgi:hypothetical protein